MKRLLVLAVLILLPFINWAQCAMCRIQVENNVSDGGLEMARGLNNGILYLFAAPYIAISVVAYFWFKQSKRNERKVSLGKRY